MKWKQKRKIQKISAKIMTVQIWGDCPSWDTFLWFKPGTIVLNPFVHLHSFWSFSWFRFFLHHFRMYLQWVWGMNAPVYFCHPLFFWNFFSVAVLFNLVTFVMYPQRHACTSGLLLSCLHSENPFSTFSLARSKTNPGFIPLRHPSLLSLLWKLTMRHCLNKCHM